MLRPVENGRRAVKATLLLIGVSATSLVVRSAHLVQNRPITEDGLVALNVSRHLATDHRLTADGIHLTNGIQPLFTFAASIPYLITSDRTEGLRLVLLLHLACYLATACIIGLIARDLFARGTWQHRLAGPFAGVAYLSSSHIITSSFNGMETGVSLLGYAVLWRYWSRHPLTSTREQLTFGALLGLVVLARIDAVFLVAVVTACFLWRRHGRPAILCGATALVVSSPWWVYNLWVDGSLMPTSGRAEHAWALSVSRLENLIEAISLEFLPWTYVSPSDTLGLALLRLAVVGVCAALAVRAIRGRTYHADHPTMTFAALIVVTMLLLAVWYALYSSAPYFYARYLAPLVLVTIVGGTWLLLTALDERRVAIATGSAVLAGGLAISMFASFYSLGGVFPGNIMLTEQVALVDARVPRGDVVAAGQSGTLAYFRDGVLNLDGKTNLDAHNHQHDMPAYLASQNVHWLCDWDDYVRRYLGPTPETIGWHKVAQLGRSGLWHRG